MYKPTIISASAGSGKTYQLAARYIMLILSNAEVESIIATTFTRKAAGEITERIYKLFLECISDANKLEQFNAVTNCSYTLDEFTSAFIRLTNNQSKLQISTLDSLFVNFAICFSLELNNPVDNNFLDTDILKKRTLYVLEKFIESLDKDNFREIKDLCLASSKKANYKSLVSFSDQFFDLLSRYDDVFWSRYFDIVPIDQSNLDILFSYILSLFQKIEENYLPKNKNGEVNQNIAKALRLSREVFLSRKFDEFNNSFWHKIRTANKYHYYSFEGDILENFLELDSKINLYLKTYYHGKCAINSRIKFALNKKLYELSEATKREGGSLILGDLKRKLVAYKFSEYTSQLYYRLGIKIKHLLLDEFQDTSLDDWTILEPIASEILSQFDSNHTFFCVGDQKQAIYEWRGGAVELFDKIKEQYPQIIETKLQRSYRSSKVIIDFVNKIFGALEASPYYEGTSVARRFSSNFEKHTTNIEGGYVSFKIVADDFEVKCAEEIILLHQSDPQSEIGVLSRDNKTLNKIAMHLRNISPDIQFSIEGGIPIKDLLITELIVSILQQFSSPNKFDAYFLSNTPFFKKLGGEEVQVSKYINEEYEKYLKLGLSEYLGFFLKENSRILTKLEIAALKALILESRKFEDIPLSDLNTSVIGAFLDHLETLKIEDPTKSKIRLLTIHKSKGLQFNKVFLVIGSNSRQNYYSAPFANNISQLDQADFIISAPDKNLFTYDDDLADIHAKKVENKELEDLNCLYVALTRAESALYIRADKLTDRHKSFIFYSALTNNFKIGEEDKSTYQYEIGSDVCKKHQGKEKLRCEVTPLISKPFDYPRLLNQQEASSFNIISDIENKVSLTSYYSMELGSRVHELMQMAQINLEDFSDFISQAEALRYGVDAINIVKQSIQDGVISSTIFGDKIAEFYNELSFKYLEDQKLIIGKIDRVQILKSGDIEILEYKTDAQFNEAHVVKSYSGQVGIYREAVRRIFGQSNQINVKIIFLKLGIVYELG